MLVAIFAVGIVILALGMSGIVCGISMFIGGLASIPSGVGVGLILSGAGLLVTAICVAVMILGSWLAFRIIPWVIRSIIAVIRRAFSPRKQITD